MNISSSQDKSVLDVGERSLRNPKWAKFNWVKHRFIRKLLHQTMTESVKKVWQMTCFMATYYLAYHKFSLSFFLQRHDIPLSKRITASLKSAICFNKGGARSSQSKNASEDASMNGGDDLEMVHTATKADKAVMQDGSYDGDKKKKAMESTAKAIDHTSRFFFPFAFVCYNIFYWSYY